MLYNKFLSHSFSNLFTRMASSLTMNLVGFPDAGIAKRIFLIYENCVHKILRIATHKNCAPQNLTLCSVCYT